MFTSHFRFYSIGIVAANKPMSTDVAQIVPIEVLPLLDGELTADRKVLESEGETATGQKYTVSVETTNVLDAKWLNIGTNRRTSPDVRRGERVLLWQYGDSDQFYWTSMNMDDNLRKLETVVWAWSDTQDETDTVLTPDNTYMLEISTHTKQVTFKTCKADGEPYKYTLQFNTKDGIVTLTDDIDNYFELHSEEHRITLQNNDGSNVILDKKDIYFYAVDDMKGIVGRDCNIQVGNNFDLSVGNDFTISVGNNQSVTVGNDQTISVGNNETVQIGSNLSVTTGSSMTLSAGTAISASAPAISVAAAGNLSLSGASMTAVSQGGFGVQASGPCNMSASNMSLDASSLTMNAGNVEISGNLKVGGNIEWGGVASGFHPAH